MKAWGKIVQPQEKHPKVIYVVVLESEVKRFAEKEKSPEKGKSSELQTVKASVAIENETTPTPEVDAPITNPPPSPSDQNQNDIWPILQNRLELKQLWAKQEQIYAKK